MHLRFKTSDVVHLVLLMVSLGATSYVAYQVVGFLGIGVLGLIIGVIALTVELERGGPIGDYYNATSLYAQHVAAVERMSAAEKAERRAEIESAALPLLVAKIVSAGLIVVGFGLFLVFQLGS
ncbi:hypothetical protein AA309_09975 [Microvirga vignae]|uniref:Uncharacterized protein n=1 Tax=Microvirga vignae TaxID=1225564 RepID=A0A0H1RDQ8_9HYPH|nr:hypothetical protein [Microvirga vignae]KLK93305.1 hypothetical protein AA309_09975 [Microvirga vignae]